MHQEILALQNQVRFSNEIIKFQKAKVNTARSIVAMLFWLYKAEQRNAKEEALSNHYNISSDTISRLETKRYCFDKAYKLLKGK